LNLSPLEVRDREGFPRPLEDLLGIIGVDFNDQSGLRAALTHPSYWGSCVLPERERLERSYERLEFLGDSVLALSICERLFKSFPEDDQGAMSKAKAHIVSKGVLLKAARRIELGDFIRVGKGVEESAGRDHTAFVVDCFEALIGAVFIDQGFERARDFVIERMSEFLEEAGGEAARDFKTELQEYAQKRHKTLPRYVMISENGPDHRKMFKVEVFINGASHGTGEGRSKKEAETEAARAAILGMSADGS